MEKFTYINEIDYDEHTVSGALIRNIDNNLFLS